MKRRSACCAFALVLASSGCSQGTNADGHIGALPAALTSLLPAYPDGPLVYVADQQTSLISVYTQAGKNQNPIDQLLSLGFPQGLWVDSHGNLYAAQPDRRIVTGYRRGAIAPFVTLHDPNEPGVVCGNGDGTIYVLDQLNLSGGQNNTIEIYEHGSVQPSGMLLDPNANHLESCAVDAAGDLFVSYATSSSGGAGVGEFPTGHTKPSVLISNLEFASGIAVTKKGNLIVNAVAQTTGAIQTYAPPYTKGPLSSFAYSGTVFSIALGPQESRLWLANASAEAAQEYSYPKGTLLDQTSSFDLEFPISIAVSPADVP